MDRPWPSTSKGFETTAGIQVQPFSKDTLVLIASRDHILAGRRLVRPADLEEETFICREPGSGTREGMRRWLRQANISPTNSLEIRESESVKRGVAAGLGLSVVSRHAIEMELIQGMLVILGGEGLSLERNLYIITRKDQRPTAATLAFLSYLHKG